MDTLAHNFCPNLDLVQCAMVHCANEDTRVVVRPRLDAAPHVCVEQAGQAQQRGRDGHRPCPMASSALYVVPAMVDPARVQRNAEELNDRANPDSGVEMHGVRDGVVGQGEEEAAEVPKPEVPEDGIVSWWTPVGKGHYFNIGAWIERVARRMGEGLGSA